ncbi:hypothetical protein DYB38_004280 [Aphanomyces astaci]|uniref:Uncharacterized protein n=1 Tax=Aphanomyces astaci TaxID=112090 RepID=A0A397CKR0_APHAT|nr:hypothetical protein DYB38_004280 [Aphanomyces astaci]
MITSYTRSQGVSSDIQPFVGVELDKPLKTNIHVSCIIHKLLQPSDTTTVTDSMPTQDALVQEPGSMAHPDLTPSQSVPNYDSLRAPIDVDLGNDGQVNADATECGVLSRWIVNQWNDTIAFESLVSGLVTTGALFVGRCPMSFPFLEMLHPSHALVPCLGIVMAATVDGLSRSKGMILSPTYAYSWDYVLITTILFDAFYAYAAFKEKLRGWRLTLQLTKAVCVGTAQTLFFLKKFGVFHGSWLVVAAPVAVWTVLLALQCQWQTLVGVTAIAAACKVSIDTSNIVSWVVVFIPIWASIAIRGFCIPQAFVTFIVVVPVVIKLEVYRVSSPADLAASAGHGMGYLWFLIVWAVPIMYYLAILSRD